MLIQKSGSGTIAVPATTTSILHMNDINSVVLMLVRIRRQGMCQAFWTSIWDILRWEIWKVGEADMENKGKNGYEDKRELKRR